jgi:serine/threonine-protein kinase
MNDLITTKSISPEEPDEAPDPAERLCRLWHDGKRPELAEFLAQFGPLKPEQLVDVLHVDQRERWQTGERIRAETYLERYPAVGENVQTAMDLIYGEFRYRQDNGEEPCTEDYLQRFPQHRTLLEEQFRFYRAMASQLSTPEPLRDPSTDSYSSGDRSSGGQLKIPRVALVAGSGPDSTSEIQHVLLRRLRFLALLSSAAMIFPPIFLAEFSRGGTHLRPGFWPNIAVCLSTLALMLALAGVLWTGQSLSLGRLRALELILFAALVVFWSWFDVFLYPEMRLPEPPFWFGLVMAKAISIPWVVIIIAYGIFIPNTWRRCAAVVGIMAVAPIVVSSITGLAADVSKDRSQWIYLLTVTGYMGTAGAIATYGAHRIEVLRQQAQVARRLGQYQLKERLGAGGMGEVYLAEHVLLRRPCAIKLIRPERAGDPKSLLRFEREVQATATLTHPNTVEILDYGHTEDGTFYCVMEYLPGLNLEHLVNRYGPLPPERVVHLLRQICGALEEAHAIGLIHRDIKPANVLVCQRGGRDDVVKLVDFGLAQVCGLAQGQKLTQEGAIAGTPAYMSPEQAAGNSELDGRSDIYSLGAVAYFLVTGHPPFVRQTAMQTLAAHIYEPPVNLDAHAPAPADLCAVVMRCLEKDPARRFAAVDAMDRALALCECADRWTREHAAIWWRNHITEGQKVSGTCLS